MTVDALKAQVADCRVRIESLDRKNGEDHREIFSAIRAQAKTQAKVSGDVSYIRGHIQGAALVAKLLLGGGFLALVVSFGFWLYRSLTGAGG